MVRAPTVRGYELSLRKADAEMVEVTDVESQTATEIGK